MLTDSTSKSPGALTIVVGMEGVEAVAAMGLSQVPADG